MPKRRVIIEGSNESQPMRPALSPEARENQLISLAYDIAEQQLRSGTASSQVITHFLKLATAKEQKELEKLELEKQLLEAKKESIQSSQRSEALYQDALKAMRRYSGGGDDVLDEE